MICPYSIASVQLQKTCVISRPYHLPSLAVTLSCREMFASLQCVNILHVTSHKREQSVNKSTVRCAFVNTSRMISHRRYVEAQCAPIVELRTLGASASVRQQRPRSRVNNPIPTHTSAHDDNQITDPSPWANFPPTMEKSKGRTCGRLSRFELFNLAIVTRGGSFTVFSLGTKFNVA